ncbi:MAG TPA: NADH-dependent [FeFe] hydrogenase, group A6 [Defluviitaleaceae bacterium]|jgi:NADP-reducing hydrogenase subunit HndD|nr:4Fe-4S dicluster domain-containing protein [Candidatus Epulonipiscium sp.]HOQ16431.1 NADH-dependent [FeFe] hydrogenase, group A6 [Defluviitaleaceae bacterium]HPT75517.1 NADH-dependent [FeFe] hydrogenase, group A6 [Defluviitaleaceae bacterium]HQD50735.1 NADH-dependent [FeFe] hydrogenase, group A6 [Defluviitaleaceae bacterium]
MSDVKVTIDGKEVEVPKGSTVLQAAHKIGIDIPTLCHLDLHDIKMVNKAASCRICVVEVEGRRNLAPACATPVFDGMVVRTNTIRVLNARRIVLELLLSDHPKDCLVCSKSGNCELQDLAERFGLRKVRFEGAQSTYRKDYSKTIIRDMDKCIMCRRCETMCNDVQTVGALSGINRGFNAVVAPAFEVNLEDSVCTHCGQCVAVCPVGALHEENMTWSVVQALADPDKVVIVQTAPAVRAALGEEFGLEPGTLVTGRMVAALRRLGFDYVFDTDFAADLTIMEEGAELLDRIKRYLDGDKTVKLPILTSCCPGWVNFIESQFQDLLDVPSSAKSPQQMFGSIAKSYFAEKLGIPREKMVVVSVMPCLAKKYEASREEFSVDGNPDVDISISTRELAHLIKKANINFNELEDEEFDLPLGESTGAAVIFGTTGGVIEAATRTAYELYTGETLEKVDFQQLRGMEGVRVATVKMGNLDLNIGIAHGLGNARKLLEEVKSGNPRNLHAIEIMACPGGCIGGGGQPYHHGNMEIIKKRAEAIYREDAGKPIRKSHENPVIKELYETYLGHPMSERAHHLLHTKYTPKDRV